ncbi:hypothetical protein Hamer_G009730 [Homarus americanus]|uniref:Uncharacterized protein n=1 Tax=Homarus americanus TaxID=6706 RepID=A0A8J5N369_HOMAM|nr:hypothetical protein Hamer_G009730 [Homarus americanus]
MSQNEKEICPPQSQKDIVTQNEKRSLRSTKSEGPDESKRKRDLSTTKSEGREDHGEASQVNVAESRSVNDELRLLEAQIKLKEAEAIAKRVGIRQAEAEAKAKEAEAKAKEADSEKLRLRIQLGQEEFLRTINEEVAVYLLDREFSTIEEVAKHADGFVLRHVGVMAGLSKADIMPIALVSTKGEAQESAVSVLASRDFDLFQESFAKDPDVGIANVACVHELPVAGVDLILGNDLAGGQMGNVTPPPVLRERPESTAELQQLEDDTSGVIHLCCESFYVND